MGFDTEMNLTCDGGGGSGHSIDSEPSSQVGLETQTTVPNSLEQSSNGPIRPIVWSNYMSEISSAFGREKANHVGR